MATRSMIIVKVDSNLIGKFAKLNPELLKHTPSLDEFKNPQLKERTISDYPKVKIMKHYIGIYHHWDGDSLGRVLNASYNTPEKALNLTLLGSCSTIIGEIVPYFLRGDDWKDIKPKCAETWEELNYCECCWVYENGTWTNKNAEEC